jgi:hypothetical protein
MQRAEQGQRSTGLLEGLRRERAADFLQRRDAAAPHTR